MNPGAGLSRSEQARLRARRARQPADDVLIAAHLATKGVTRYPVAAVAPTAAVIPELDRAILQATELGLVEVPGERGCEKIKRQMGARFARRAIPADLAAQLAAAPAPGPARAASRPAAPRAAGVTPEMSREAFEAAIRKAEPSPPPEEDDDVLEPARPPSGDAAAPFDRFLYLWSDADVLVFDTIRGTVLHRGETSPPLFGLSNRLLTAMLAGGGAITAAEARRMSERHAEMERALAIIDKAIWPLGLEVHRELNVGYVVRQTPPPPAASLPPVPKAAAPAAVAPVAAPPPAQMRPMPLPRQTTPPAQTPATVALAPPVPALTGPSEPPLAPTPGAPETVPEKPTSPDLSPNVLAFPQPAAVAQPRVPDAIAYTPSARMWERMRAHAAAVFREGGPELSPERIMEDAMARFLDMEEAVRAKRELKAARWWM